MRSSARPDAAPIHPKDPQSALLSLLQLACGSSAGALDVLDRALARAGRQQLPAEASNLMAFVRDHLLDVLAGKVGIRLATALADDLLAELGDQATASPPASVARRVPQREALSVALVDPDPLGRAALARALVRQRWAVSLLDAVGDVAAYSQGDERDPVDVVVVEPRHPASTAILASLVRTQIRLAIVLRSDDATRARTQLNVLDVGGIEVVPARCTGEDLVNAIRRMTRPTLGSQSSGRSKERLPP